MERVVVLGASNKEDRYSYKALNLLMEFGHSVVPVHPTLSEVLGQKVVSTIKDVKGDVDTVTLYVKPALVDNNIDDIISLKPKRVIFNPGTESESSMEKLKSVGIEPVIGCTLIMLNTNQY